MYALCIRLRSLVTSDLVWWWRQRTNDLGLGTWFQPSIEVQRKGVSEAQLGEDPVIARGATRSLDNPARRKRQ